ncbi:serine hydrolase domain-containing protein [Brevibacillus composti]|uniref:Beta-lactamase family protein n=1 Tax=Brevibacillus composti TaxID=2796470 RepID=A0A7T5EJ56_9BACL|nr:serine hydrolase domain-containing protein [Brevibacillus composti]QQE73570.1 beta-lactamase family protein [Brevibacillus composti]
MEAVGQLLRGWIDEGLVPGASLRIMHRGEVIFACDAGRTSLEADGLPVTADTLFDLASLTKVAATLPALLLLMQAGALREDDPLSRFFPDCPEEKRSITILQLLTHTSGLPADLAERRRDSLLRLPELLYALPLQHAPGERVVYSDMGMIWLGLLAEKAAGEPLAQFLERSVWGPLGMKQTCFCPSQKSYANIASTEYCQLTQRYISGEVHDEKAYAMGGVAGHAGLFATADDLCRYARMWLTGSPPLLSPEIRSRATQCRTEGRGGWRGLGWEIKGAAEGSSCGSGFFPGSYGHTGFTGTSLWIDPQQELAVVFLTNAVHLGRDHRLRQLRPILHDAVTAQLNRA